MCFNRRGQLSLGGLMKLVSLSLLVALVVCVAGCGEEKKPEGGGASAAPAGAKPASSAAAKPAGTGGW
jgi:hypothetical protein